MYIRQEPLLSFEDLMELQPQTKLELILENVDWSEVVKIIPRSRKGPNGYHPIPIIRALLAQQIEQIPTRAALVRRLVTDPVFRYVCGFNVIGKVPSEATFSRYYSILSQTDYLERVYLGLVNRAIQLGLMETDVVAIDATDLTSYERAKPKKKLDLNNSDTPDWGSKNDSHGNQKTWFGWKLHIAVDTKSELPLALILSQASKADGEFAIPLAEKVYQQCRDKNYKTPKYWTMDSGYDWASIYDAILNTYQGQAIIPINKRRATQPPEGYYDFHGTPMCSCGYAMVYWGHGKGYNKFRCPHVLGKVDCPNGSAWCSNSNYGAVVKTRAKDDPRFIATPHRGTKNWTKLYNKRTSVERCFSRLKEHLNLENITVMGKKSVLTHVLLSCIALIAAKIATFKFDLVEIKVA